MFSKKFLYCIACIGFLLLTNLVYLIYGSHATSEYRFTGANPYAAADKLVYMSMIQQGREGILFMRNLHTIDPQRGMLLSPHWYLIGMTGTMLNLSNAAVYQLYRIIFTLIFLFLFYFVLQKLFKKKFDFLMATLFVFFSGGLGWFIFIKYPSIVFSSKGDIKFLNAPIDLYVTEGNTLLNFMQAPLFSLSQLLILLIFFIFVKYSKEKSIVADWINALLTAFLILIHPYDAPIIFAVLGTWAILQLWLHKDFLILKKLAIVLGGGILGIAYNSYMLIADPVIKEWYNQNLVYSPPLKQYVLGYGLLVPLWLAGIIGAIREKKYLDPWWALLLCWSSIIWLLLYLPITVNRRFVNGWHIALAVVAAYGFVWILRQIRQWWLKLVVTVVTFLFLFSSLGFVLFVSVAYRPEAHTYGYYFISRDEDRVIAFLRTNSQPNDAFLPSDMKTAFTLTAELNRAVYRGHEHQTPQAYLKQETMDWFFSENQGFESLTRKREFLRDQQIAYVILNRASDRLTVPLTWIDTVDFLKNVFSAGNLTVYYVALNTAPMVIGADGGL